MKRLFFILILVPFLSFSQDQPLKYTEVVKVDSASKDQLYQRAKKWFATNYKSAKDVLQLDDKENGELLGKGGFSVAYYFRSPFIQQTISISVKEGRYKYSFSDFNYTDKQGDTFSLDNFPKSWTGKAKLFEKVDASVKETIASLTKAMSQNDNW